MLLKKLSVILFVLFFGLTNLFLKNSIEAQNVVQQPSPSPTPNSVEWMDEIAGVWKLKIESQDKGIIPTQERIFIFIKKDDGSFIVKDAITNKESKGTEINGKVQFDVKTFIGDKELKTNFAGNLISNEELTGTATTENNKLVWEATKLVVFLYACENHNDPRHTATTHKEMKEKTEKYGCKNWST